ncbi:hypothetical protein RBSH_02655 [Rhodopirellula baltica SH28]|uniref:Uncharacterized protein n=1 Tax=Rhodopirellula baltica SH28 TaxID=993517 RepID=K5D5W5_RHOBT|nr:hypothetical protein RBSH_02655 [Rhodopirellula baltica SH28]
MLKRLECPVAVQPCVLQRLNPLRRRQSEHNVEIWRSRLILDH